MNLQGDEPLMNVEDIKNLHNQMIKNESGFGTLASIITKKKSFQDQNIVKVMTKKNLDTSNFPEALNFMRKVDKQNEKIYHHLGIYCYKKEVLKTFISLDQSSNEIKNRLEQFRALDNNIEINVALAKFSPIGVDTEEDFVAIKKIMEYKSK
jgi:3-deoxy-manno-octulosonate cytidylyltransferase (CMP-KDO synthetase)